MKVQYISSACVVVEHENIKILCDPWLSDGIYYGSWYHFPALTVRPEDFHEVDYIYLSHIHPDHCDVETLKTFPKQTPVLILQYEENFLYRLLKSLGFENIIELQHNLPHSFTNDFSITIFAADNCNPLACGRWFSCQATEHPNKTLQIDSLAVFSGGGKILVNVNDCPFPISKVVCEDILKKYRSIDFLLVGYSGAGPYPQCFKNLNHIEKIEEAENKKMQFINQAVSYLAVLNPSHFLPFAGQYTLGGKFSELNQYRGVPELEDLENLITPLLKKNSILSKMILLNSLKQFDLNTNQASAVFLPPSAEDRKAYISNILKYKKYSYENQTIAQNMVSEIHTLLIPAFQHMRSKLIHYNFTSLTYVYFDIGAESVFSIPFDGKDLSVVSASEIREPYILIELHPHLFEMILKRQAHFNNAEIGSHLSFHRAPNIFERGISHFLCYLN